MRLIRTATLELSEFFDSDIPKYAILSHCWGKDEVSLQEFQNGEKKEGSGYAKIMNCCRLARERNLEWAWVDTCCIDKSSSAELSEAINSMFRWYERAYVCFVFLSDFSKGQADSALSGCRWFTRGFTLQELLAPPRLEFYDSRLTWIGTRTTLCEVISQAAKISWAYLVSQGAFRDASVAQRMSWAARRQTSRSEDIAYCLLGLFDVNMPLLYGEGASKAFRRLQHQIIAQSTDESIFAWLADTPYERRGMLARSPSEFASCESIHRCTFRMQRPPYAVTGNGLEIAISAIRAPTWAPMDLSSWFTSCEVQLACELWEPNMPAQTVSIVLCRHRDGQSWFRANANLRIHRASRMIQTVDFLICRYTPIYVSETHALEETRMAINYETRASDIDFFIQVWPGVMELLSLALGLKALDVCSEGGACRDSEIVVMWMYLSLGWRVSAYRYRYLSIVAVAAWLYGGLTDMGINMVGLAFLALMEAISI